MRIHSLIGRRGGLAAVLATSLVGGLLWGAGGAATEAYAAVCQATNTNCNATDPNKMSSLHVRHVVPGMVNNTPVEPDDGETWNITAYWNTATAPCQQYTETASVEVSWNGTGWVLTNKTTTTNITAIDVCDLDTCSAEDTHSWGYELRENIVDPVTIAGTRYNLRQVVYTTTAEDDGFELDTANCTLGTAVSPDSASYTATDSGPFECAYSCGATVGPTVNITYQ